jgi:hypothetical protein
MSSRPICIADGYWAIRLDAKCGDVPARSRARWILPDYGPAADYAIYLRFARDGRVVTSRSSVRYRQHTTSMSRDPVLMLRATQLALRREGREGPRWARGDTARPTRLAELVWRANRRSCSRGVARTPVAGGTRESRTGAALELPGTGPSARHA